MTVYKILPAKCSECLWINCCTWFYDRDPFRCRNQTTKDRYVKGDQENGVSQNP